MRFLPIYIAAAIPFSGLFLATANAQTYSQIPVLGPQKVLSTGEEVVPVGVSGFATLAPNGGPTKIGQYLFATGNTILENRKVASEQKGMGLSSLTLTAICAYDPESPEKKVKGFELLLYDDRQITGPLGKLGPVSYHVQYHLAYIDIDEAAKLVKALRYMSQAYESAHEEFTEDKTVTFRGIDDYRFYYDQRFSFGERTKQYTAFGGIADSPRVTLKNSASILDVASGLEDGLTWLEKQ